MTASRLVPTLVSDPGGADGEEYTTAVQESISALWALSGGMLANVAGTNAITAEVAISGGFTTLEDGFRCEFVPVNPNTGPMSLDLGLGAKSLVDQDGAALGAAAVLADRVTPAIFLAASDHFRLIGSGGDSYVTINGGLQLQRSAPSRAVASAGPATALTPLVSVNMQTSASTNRVVVEGSVARMVGTGAQDTTGTVIALYVDDVEAETVTGWCQPDQFMTTPFAFEYFPGDTDSHTYQIRVSSTVEATYPAEVNFVVATEMSPNS